MKNILFRKSISKLKTIFFQCYFIKESNNELFMKVFFYISNKIRENKEFFDA